MPDSEVARMVAVVPSWSGAKSSSTFIVTTAFASSSSAMSVIEPIGCPPTRTSLPLHELAGVVEDGVDRVRRAVAEHRERDQRHGGDQRRDRYDAGDRRSPLVMERFADPSLSRFR